MFDYKVPRLQLREMMEYQQNRDQYDGLEDAANSSSGGVRRGTYRRDGDSSELSGNVRGDDDDSDDDDNAAMTPRGVYVQRCLCASSAVLGWPHTHGAFANGPFPSCFV